MKVSALGPWLTILACVLLITVSASYYYHALQKPPPDPTPAAQGKPPPEAPPPKARGTAADEPPPRPKAKGSERPAPQPSPRPEPPQPRPAGGDVLVLVLQTDLLTREAEQAELVKELKALVQKQGRRLLGGGVHLVNKERAGAPWDVERQPLRAEAAFASADVKETFAACARAMRRTGAARTLLVWGCDIDPEMADVSKEDLKLPRPVTLFWIGHADDSLWLRDALGRGSKLLRLDRDIRSLRFTLEDHLGKEP
jgi:hypothetical protein